MGLKELMSEFSKDDSLPEDPVSDAMLLVDALREYLPMIPGDYRTKIFRALADGYCESCGSDWKCSCESRARHL